MSTRTAWDDIEAALAARPARSLAAPCAQRAAVALVLRAAEAEIELLFVRRAEHPEDPWSGHIAFPGGRAEPGDQDLLATAVRETEEETGLDLDGSGALLGRLDEIQAVGHGGPFDLSIAPFVFRLRGPADVTLGDEAVSAHWMRLAALLAPSSRGTLDVSIAGVVCQRPCLRIGDQVIWGLTYRMFVDLAERLEAGTAEGVA